MSGSDSIARLVVAGRAVDDREQRQADRAAELVGGVHQPRGSTGELRLDVGHAEVGEHNDRYPLAYAQHEQRRQDARQVPRR